MSQLAIDQASDSANTEGVILAVLAVGLGQALVTAETINGILDNNTTTRKSMIVSDIFGRAGLVFAPGFLAWRGTQWVQLSDALIGRITQATNPFRQSLQELGLLQQLLLLRLKFFISQTIVPVFSSTATWLFRVWVFFLPL